MPPPHDRSPTRTAQDAVKREVLVRYLDSAAPAMLHSSRKITYAQGYADAGPGEHGADPAAVAALRVFGEFADLLAGRTLSMVLVGTDPDRLAAVAGPALGPRCMRSTAGS